MKAIGSKVKDALNMVKDKIKTIFKKERKNEKTDVDIVDIDINEVTFKRKRKFFPSVVVASGEKVKTALTFSVPVLLIATGIVLGVTLNDKTSEIPKSVIIETNKTYHRVYLLSDDDYVVPLTIKMDQRQTMVEELVEVFSLLKTDSKAATNSLRGYIPSDTKLLNLEISETVLTLNMSNEFHNYTETNEIKMLESLVYTFLDFEGISELKLQVEGEKLETLKNTSMSLNFTLNKDIGLNRLSYLENNSEKTRSVVFFNKTYDNVTYMVPVSIYNESSNKINSFIDSTKYKPNLVSGLEQIDTYDQLDYQVEPLINDQGIFIAVEQSALLEEGIISSEIYELILLSFSLMDVTQSVSLQVDGESYQVNGYYYEDDVEVSSITYNIVAI